ncbi:type VI secretion system baseplate subunit TssG [Alteromonadaceae bacterium BrNp21-10]|nr:type VI secretion system baseplate subunit TssG [Alteromonadaceae bacterium BrNp21-10]
MAAQDGSAKYPVIDELQNRPQRFSFFQAVRLLEQYHQSDDMAAVGHHGPTTLEKVRFRPHASLGFASADLKRITPLRLPEGDKSQLEVNFMGLYGTVSPLPAFYTESIIQDSDGESNRRDFLDLFHHRAISLHYRILSKYLLFNRIQPGLQDDVSNWLFSLIGLRGVTGLSTPPLTKLHRLLANLGLLATQNRSGAMVSRIVSHYFDRVPVKVEEFVERQVLISDEQRVSLGKQQSTLGENMTIGTQLTDMAGKFRLIIGPLDFARYQDFLPGETDFDELVTLIRYLLQDPLSFDICLVLKSKNVPQLTLAKASPCKLGWSSWLGQPPKTDKHVIISQTMT